MVDVIGSDIYVVGFFVVIFGIIKLVVEFIDYMIWVCYDVCCIKEEYLDMYFIELFCFCFWEEVEIGEGDIYKIKNDEEENYEEEEEYSLNFFGEFKKKKKKN